MPDPTNGGDVDLLLSKVYGTDYQNSNYKEIANVGIQFSFDKENWTDNTVIFEDDKKVYSRCWSEYADHKIEYTDPKELKIPAPASEYQLKAIQWARSRSPVKNMGKWDANDKPQWYANTFIWNRLLIGHTGQEEETPLEPTCCPHAIDDSVSSSVRAVFGVVKDDEATYGIMPVVQIRDANTGRILLDVIEELGGGANSHDGRGIESTSVSYQVSNSGLVIPDEEWSTTVPEVNQSQFLWTRIEFLYSDNTNSYAYMVARSGDKGPQGDDGNGLISIDYEWYRSNSMTEVIGGSWSATIPEREGDTYLWVRTTVKYTQTDPVTYEPVCITGPKGNVGDQGVSISSISQKYYVSESRIALLGGEWIDTPPIAQDDKYIWTKLVIAMSDESTQETQPLCSTGQKGAAGDEAPEPIGADGIMAIWNEVFGEPEEEPEEPEGEE